MKYNHLSGIFLIQLHAILQEMQFNTLTHTQKDEYKRWENIIGKYSSKRAVLTILIVDEIDIKRSSIIRVKKIDLHLYCGDVYILSYPFLLSNRGGC